MRMAKGINICWMMSMSFLIGRIDVHGMNPFIVGMVVAACITNKNIIGTYLAGVLGLATCVQSTVVVKYAIMMLGLIAIFNLKALMEVQYKKTVVCTITFLFVVMINYSTEYLLNKAIGGYSCLLEGIISSSAIVIFVKTIECLCNDYAKICVDNQAAISVVIVLAMALLGLPNEIGGIIIAQAVALFSIMLFLYKFGMGIGLSWGVVASIITAYTHSNYDILAGWLITIIITFSLEQLCNFRRMGFALTYMITYYGVGITLFPDFVDLAGQKSIVSAGLTFMLLPQFVITKLDGRLKSDEFYGVSSEWGRLVIDRISSLALACKRIEYTLAGNSKVGIRLNEIGEIIEGFTNQIDNAVAIRKTVEANILEELARKGIVVKSILATKNEDKRFEVYINARSDRNRLISASEVVKTVSKNMNIPLELKDEGRRVIGGRYGMICMKERARYTCESAVRKLVKYEEEVSGDNYFIGDILEGNKLIIIADGMGSGNRAKEDSERLIDTMEELLDAGFDKDMAVKLINSYLAEQNRGEHFSTLDMLVFDTYTGCGRIYKQGAATTFIKRGQWVEMIKSTSLPVGVVHNAACEKCVKKFYEDDIIIMLSDGVLDSIIVENKDDYITDFIQQSRYYEPEEIANDLVENIIAMSGNRLKDDATIIVSKIAKRC